MFDAAAISTIEKAVDLSNGADIHEQQAVLAALASNQHAIATQSLLDAIGDPVNASSDYSSIHEVVFIDSTVQDPQKLISSISRNAAVEMINPGQDGIAEITALLQKYHHLDAIHIISHGEEGELFLGNTTLSAQNVNQYSSDLASWGSALNTNADVLLYGCDLAKGTSGVNFLQTLSQMTSANIAASTDATGGAALGGNWDLEYSKNISAKGLVDPVTYDHLLLATDNPSPPADHLTIDGFSTNTTYRPGLGGATLQAAATASIHGLSTPDSVTIGFTSGAQSGDRIFFFSDSGSFQINNAHQITDINNNVFATFDVLTTPENASYLHVTPVGESAFTAAQITAILAHLQFDNSSTNMSILTATRTLDFSIHDNLTNPELTMTITAMPGPSFGAINLNPTYLEGDPGVQIFSTLSGYSLGTDVNGLTITITNVHSGDILSIEGTDLAIGVDHSSITIAPGGLSTSFLTSLSGTTATVSLSTGYFSTSELFTLIPSLTFRTTSLGPQLPRTFSLPYLSTGPQSTVQENGTFLYGYSTVTTTEFNTPPTLSVTAANPTYLIDGGVNGAHLFSAPSASPVESGQTFTGMVLTITNLAGTGDISGDIISFDGTDILISNATFNYTTANHGLVVNGLRSGETASFSFSGASLTSTMLNNLIAGITLRTTDPHSAPTQKISITQLTDSGSNINPNSNTSVFSTPFSSTVTITPFNSPPTFSATSLNPRFLEGTAPVPLFSNIQVDPVESGQVISYAEVHITNVEQSDFLKILGTYVSLTNGTHATLGGRTTAAVSVDANNTATVAFTFPTTHLNATETVAFQSIMAMSFKSTASFFRSTTRIVTLTEIQDSGPNGGLSSNTTLLNVSSTIKIIPLSHMILNHSLSNTTGSLNSAFIDLIDLFNASDATSLGKITTPDPSFFDSYQKNHDLRQVTALLNQLLMNFKQAGSEQSSEIANSLYEIAVTVTRQTNTTTLLQNVVDTIVTSTKNQSQVNIDQFLSKVANDTRLVIDERASIVNNFIQQGKQSEAKILLEKLDKAANLETEKNPKELAHKKEDEQKNNCN